MSQVSPAPRERCISDAEWKRYLSRELSSPDRKSVDLHLDVCTSCAGVLRSLVEQSTALPSSALRTPGSVPRATGSGLAVGSEVAERYRIVRVIGRGGMGEVYEAEDIQLQERVALKTIRGDLEQDPQLFDRFKREIRLARRVTHPNVCRLFEYGLHREPEVCDIPFLTMELVDGPTLSTVLRGRGAMSCDEARPLLRQIAAGLDAAHGSGVIHRDLKSSNVLLAGEGDSMRAVVTDFGLARSMSDETAFETHRGGMVGTPAYVSPEQLQGLEVDSRADVYALGVLAYEMVTNRFPFEARDAFAVAIKRLNEAPVPLRSHDPELPEHWEEAIRRCLERDRAARFQRASEFVDALAGGAASAAQPRRRWPRRALIVALAGLLSVGGIAAGALSLSSDDRGEPGAAPAATSLSAVAISARAADSGAEPSLPAAVQQMLAARLERGLRIPVAHAATGDVTLIELTVSDRGGRAHVTARLAGEPLAEVEAESFSAAVDEMVAAIRRRLPRGWVDRRPTQTELAQMRALGGTSFPAWRSYLDAEPLFATTLVDAASLVPHVENAIRLDPEWGHAHALLALLQGTTSADAVATAARARRSITDRERDPVGWQLIEALDEFHRGDAAAATRRLEPLYRDNPDDMVVGAVLFMTLSSVDERTQAIALLGALHRRRPDLQWGGDLLAQRRLLGDARADAFLQEWQTSAPGSEARLATEVSHNIMRNDLVAAERSGRRLILLHGRSSHRLLMLADVLINAGKRDDAQQILEELLLVEGVVRPSARYRLAIVSVMEGRFASALGPLRAAVAEGGTYGAEFRHTATLEELRVVAELVGDKATADAATEQLIEAVRRSGKAELAAAIAVLDRPATGKDACAAVRKAIARAPRGDEGKEMAFQYLLRRAAMRGCTPCTDAIRAGDDALQLGERSRLEFALCAGREGALVESETVLREIATRRFAPPKQGLRSTYHMILARFHLAHLLRQQGHLDEAKKWYQEVVDMWQSADRPLPELEQARAALRALASSPSPAVPSQR